MLIASGVFLAGLTVLLASGHVLVGSASRIGVRSGLPPIAVGITIVAAGTSAPELAVVGQAIAVDDTELAVGSIIGSNIANVLLVLGLAATFGTITVSRRAIRVDVPVMIGASAALLILSLDGALSRWDGLLLIGGLTGYVGWNLRSRNESPEVKKSLPNEHSVLVPMLRDLALLIGSAIVLAFAARWVVRGAEDIAAVLGVPELILGLTVVALGTSSPEIATTLIAAASGRRNLAIGNAVGSNIFNILLVLGAGGLVAPSGLPISEDALRLDITIMLASAIACLPIVATDSRLERWEGYLFVAYYVAFVVFLVLDTTGNGAADPFAFVMCFFVIPLTALTVGIVFQRRRALRSRR